MASIEEYCAVAFKSACIAELEALKPGNVHIFADGHGMRVQDFMRSAEVSSGPISTAGISLGQQILGAMRATHDAVGCNTNLGIVLLCAPLIQAAYMNKHLPFNSRLDSVLQRLTQEDAVHVFEAIRLANPAGLGKQSQHDVHQAPQCTLREAMLVAADRDMLAKQYVQSFVDVWAGLDQYRALLNRWKRSAWATTGLYLSFMANFPDSHILRKYDATVAEEVKKQAISHSQALLQRDNPKTYMTELLAWDGQLKAQSINPGTSADLTVSVLLLHNFLNNSEINSFELTEK